MTNITQSDEAAQRNKEPIFEAALPFLQWADSVFEIGTGAGTHADYFLTQLPSLTWQPSDIAENIDPINTYFSTRNTNDRVAPAVEFELPLESLPRQLRNRYDLVYTSNTLHIMPWQAVESLFNHITDIINSDGFFISYGPFSIDGELSDSNRQFEKRLKEIEPHRGIRELRDLERINPELRLLQANKMPANNYLLVWET